MSTWWSALSETATPATHYALAVLTGCFTWRLMTTDGRRCALSPRPWAAAFAAVALCALCGGTHQAFGAYLDPAIAQSLWRATLCLAGAAALLFLSVIVHAYTSGPLRAALLALGVVKFVLLVLWITGHDDLHYVVYDIAATLLAVLCLSAWGAWSRHGGTAPWILGAILVSLVAALMQQGRVALHPAFDHNNLFHVIQTFAMYLLFRAGLQTRELPDEPVTPAAVAVRSES